MRALQETLHTGDSAGDSSSRPVDRPGGSTVDPLIANSRPHPEGGGEGEPRRVVAQEPLIADSRPHPEDGGEGEPRRADAQGRSNLVVDGALADAQPVDGIARPRWIVIQPCWLTVHLLTIALSCFLFLGEQGQRSNALGALRADLARIFYPETCVDGWETCESAGCHVLPDCRLTEVAQLQAMVRRVVQRHDGLPTLVLGSVEPLAGWPVTMRITSKAGGEQTYSLNATGSACLDVSLDPSCPISLGPLSSALGPVALRSWLDSVASLELLLRLVIRTPRPADWLPWVSLTYPDDLSHLRWLVRISTLPAPEGVAFKVL